MRTLSGTFDEPKLAGPEHRDIMAWPRESCANDSTQRGAALFSAP